MGWWLQLIGLIIIFIGGGFSLVGFIISPQQTIINSIRTFFSQTQSIKVLPQSLGGNDSLNLDNIATLKLFIPYSFDSVTLLLDVVPTALPNKHTQNFFVEDAQYYDHTSGIKYVFDKKEHKRQEIIVGDRIFIVTLLKIIKLNIVNVPSALEYQFGISEK